MADLHDAIAAEAERTAFSGVVRVDREEETLVAQAFGLADRGREVPNTVGTRFALASGAKGFTALVVMSLVEDGTLGLDTTARSVLGDDLPLINGAVTVEHLLAHRSGIGDYLDEDTTTDAKAYLMPVPPHTLESTEDYVSMLDGHPQVSAPGERFAYNNAGFVVLALIAERASGEPFHRLVAERVSKPCGSARHRLPAIGRAPGGCGPRLPVDRSTTHERLPPPGARDRRRRDLLDGRRPLAVLGNPLRGRDRVSRCRCRDGAPTERLAGGGTPVRARVPPARDDRCRVARGLRRGDLVHEYARARPPDHGHRDLEHGRGCVAARTVARPRARDLGSDPQSGPRRSPTEAPDPPAAGDRVRSASARPALLGTRFLAQEHSRTLGHPRVCCIPTTSHAETHSHAGGECVSAASDCQARPPPCSTLCSIPSRKRIRLRKGSRTRPGDPAWFYRQRSRNRARQPGNRRRPS